VIDVSPTQSGIHTYDLIEVECIPEDSQPPKLPEVSISRPNTAADNDNDDVPQGRSLADGTFDLEASTDDAGGDVTTSKEEELEDIEENKEMEMRVVTSESNAMADETLTLADDRAEVEVVPPDALLDLDPGFRNLLKRGK
jgi:hypothetical protein